MAGGSRRTPDEPSSESVEDTVPYHRGREPHDEDEGERDHRHRSHARRTHGARHSECVAAHQTWQVACQVAVKKGLLSAAQQRRRRRPLTPP
jgi:hypothetical protein